MNINEIISKYTTGEATVEETNAALKEAGAGFHLEPGKNVLTEGEMRATTVGHFPDQANGFGLLDSGTGTLDKVEVRGGKLVNCDMGGQKAMLIIAGKTYYVHGATLVEKDPYANEGASVPKMPDMSRRPDMAGQIARQKTKSGVYDVQYNEDGYAVKATPVKFN